MQYYSLICPNGRLDFTKDQLTSSVYIKGTIIEATFFPQTNLQAKTELHLTWSIGTAEQLIPLIRKGVIYACTQDSQRTELYDLLEFLAGDNLLWHQLSKCVKEGTMDKLGTYVPNVKKYNSSSIPYNSEERNSIRNTLLSLIAPKLTEWLVSALGTASKLYRPKSIHYEIYFIEGKDYKSYLDLRVPEVPLVHSIIVRYDNESNYVVEDPKRYWLKGINKFDVNTGYIECV